MKKIIDTLIKQKRLVLLLSLLIVSFVVSLKFSSYSWAINPTIKKDGYVKITNIKNGDIIPNKKDVVVEYSADSMTMPMREVRYIGRIRYLILTVNGEPYGTYESTQDKGTYTFQIDLSKLDDETPVKLQALGYLHIAPKTLIRLWEQKKMKIDQLQNFLRNLAQFKSEETGVTKDNNPTDLPKSVDPEEHNQQNTPSGNYIYKDPSIKQPEEGIFRWIKYQYSGKLEPFFPGYSTEYPSTWQKLGEGNTAFRELHTTTGVSIGIDYVPAGETTTSWLQKHYLDYYKSQGYTTESIIVSGIESKHLKGKAQGTSYIHEGDYNEIILIPYDKSGRPPLILELNFLNDKYKADRTDYWKHILSTFNFTEG